MALDRSSTSVSKPAATSSGSSQWCTRAAVLDAWTQHDWSRGVHVEALEAFQTVHVRTQNNLYEITVLSPTSGEVLVRGGRFFPERTRAHLAGSSMGGSFLKLRSIHPGFSVEFYHLGRRIITSRVQSIVSVPAEPSVV
jgi:hypothetical protein